MYRRRLFELLDDSRLDGAHGVRRFVGPPLHGHLVDHADLSDAVDAVAGCCERWGGSSDLLIPWRPDDGVPTAFSNQLHWSWPVNVFGRGVVSEDARIGRFPIRRGHLRYAASLIGMLAGQSGTAEDRQGIRASLPEPSHPWFVSYLATLGTLPERPDPQLLQHAGLPPDLDFSRLVEVERGIVAEPSGGDLLSRLRAYEVATPADASRWLLVGLSAPAGHGRGTGRLLPHRFSEANNFGANVVVVYEPGSIQDLCLTWNLRAAHARPEGLPLAVPATDDVPKVIREWRDQHAHDWLGVPLINFGLVSCSVGEDTLDAICRELGDGWTTTAPGHVLQRVRANGRPSTEVAVFESGFASVTTLSGNDRTALGLAATRLRGLEVQARFELIDRSLPMIWSIRPNVEMAQPGYDSGAFTVWPHERDEVATIQWPSGWTLLAGGVRDRQLRASPSRPGQAASALLRAFGALDGVEMLLSPGILELLERLGERRGSTWFRKQARRLSAAVAADDPERAEALDEAVADLRRRPLDEEQHDVTFDRLKQLWSSEAASEWLAWAEDCGLLLRGTKLACQRCGRRDWYSMSAISPPILCRGCSRPIEHPFREDLMTFSYRASDLLLSVAEHDAVSHLLVLRWFCRLLDPWPRGGSLLYGGYPGVDLEAADTRLGEADVLLLTAHGDLIPGEVKRRGAGLTKDDIAKLDRISDALEAPWSFVATPDFAADCPQLWNEAVTHTDRPRFALTGEHLFSQIVTGYGSGEDPFGHDGPFQAKAGTVEDELRLALEGRRDMRHREQIPGRLLPENDEWDH